MLELWIFSVVAMLGLLAYFEPCTIATHTLFAARKTLRPSTGCCDSLLAIWLARLVLLSLWLGGITLIFGPILIGNLAMASGLAVLGLLYLISRKIYLPVPHLEFWRLLPWRKKLSDAVRLGLTLPACTLPLLVVVSFISLRFGQWWIALLCALLWSSFFTLPIAWIRWRGLPAAGRQYLNAAASVTPYITALLFFIAAIWLATPALDLSPSALKNTLQHASPLAIFISFAAGFIFSFNPVSFASIPVVLAYVTQAHEKRRALALGAAFIGGMILTHVVLGVAAAAGGEWAQSLMARAWGLLLGPLLIVLGLLWAGLISIRLPWFSSRARRVSGFWGAFVLGIPFSVAVCPFCAPALLIALTSSAAIGSISFGFALLLAFALGRSIPILLGAWAIGWLESLQSLTRHQQKIETAGGVILILSGLYLLNEYFLLIGY